MQTKFSILDRPTIAYRLAILPVKAKDLAQIYDRKKSQFLNSKAEVLRRLVNAKFKIRIVISKSYKGKRKINFRVRCDTCSQNYVLDGEKKEFEAGSDTTLIINSDKKTFCKCQSRKSEK